MGLFMNLLKLGNTVVGIDLGGSQTGMTQQFLDRVQVGPPGEQVRRKGMSQNVRALLQFGGHLTKILINNAINKRFVNLNTVLGQKQEWAGSGIPQLLTPGQIPLDQGDASGQEGDDAFLVPFAEHLQGGTCQIDVVQS